MKNLIITGAAGKMGQAIISMLANFKNLNLIGAVDTKANPKIGELAAAGIKFSSDLAAVIQKADVIVDFTGASASTQNIATAEINKKPIVIGSTGQTKEDLDLINSASKKIPVVFSPNMSVGMNLMWKFVFESSKTLGENYKIYIEETHHIHKKDAPSGTAKKIIEEAVNALGLDPGKDVEQIIGSGEFKNNKKISVRALREGEVIGDHVITFASPFETFSISHSAVSRSVFANGALRAAEWICGKKAGLYSMKDVLGL